MSYSRLQRLGNIAQENTTNQTADVLVEDQLQPPLDMVTVDQERELHKPNIGTKRGSFVVLIIQPTTKLYHKVVRRVNIINTLVQACCVLTTLMLARLCFISLDQDGAVMKVHWKI